MLSGRNIEINSKSLAATNKPMTLFGLLIHFIKGFIKSIPSLVIWTIVRAILAFILVFVIHTYLVVVQNEGFSPDPGSPIYRLIAFPGTKGSAIAFWSMLTYILFSVAGRIWFRGPLKFFSDLISFPHWTITSFSRAKRNGLAAFLAGITMALLGSLLFKSNYVLMILLIGIFLSYTQQKQGLWFLVLSTGWNDGKRMFKIKGSVNHGIVAVLLFGLIIGLICSLILQPGPTGHLIGAAVCITGIILTARKKVSQVTVMWTILFLAINVILLRVFNVYADDGGWRESGSTLASWFNSAGADLTMTMGLPPALISMLTALLGGTNVPVPPPIPDVMDYNVDGWKWVNQNGRWVLYQVDSNGNTYGTGLTQGIFEVSDENFGNRIKMYTTPTCNYDGFADKTNTAFENFGSGYYEHFTRDGWRAMNNSQREAALRSMSRQIADVAGVDPNSFTFNLVNDPSRGLNGSWSPGSRTLEINSNSRNFDNPLKMIRTLAHEMRHAAQGDPNISMGGDQEYRNLITWNDQDSNYRTAGSDFTRYSGQLLERDAEGFGRAVSRTFYQRVLASQQ